MIVDSQLVKAEVTYPAEPARGLREETCSLYFGGMPPRDDPVRSLPCCAELQPVRFQLRAANARGNCRVPCHATRIGGNLMTRSANKIKSSHRADASITIAGKRAIVKLPNTSALGYGKYHAEPGDFVVFDLARGTDWPDVRYGRVLGRVDAAGWDGADRTPIKGFIAVMMLGERLNHAYEMWVDPADVTFCESQSSHVTFFATLFNASPEHLLRMSKYGSLSTHGTCALPPVHAGASACERNSGDYKTDAV